MKRKYETREWDVLARGEDDKIKIWNERMRFSRQGGGNQSIFETSKWDALIRGVVWFWKYFFKYYFKTKSSKFRKKSFNQARFSRFQTRVLVHFVPVLTVPPKEVREGEGGHNWEKYFIGLFHVSEHVDHFKAIKYCREKKREIVWSFTKLGGEVPPDQTISGFYRLFIA